MALPIPNDIELSIRRAIATRPLTRDHCATALPATPSDTSRLTRKRDASPVSSKTSSMVATGLRAFRGGSGPEDRIPVGGEVPCSPRDPPSSGGGGFAQNLSGG